MKTSPLIVLLLVAAAVGAVPAFSAGNNTQAKVAFDSIFVAYTQAGEGTY